jgi:predicted deacetylase
MTPSLIIEVHDVSPLSSRETSIITRALDKTDAHPVSLLVVPEHADPSGRRWQLSRNESLSAWLRQRVHRGDEIVHHGLTHRAPGPPPAGLRNAFMHHIFSRGCNEFAHLSYAQAYARLRRGRALLAECGLQPRGFVAPAWQQSLEAISALKQLNYTFTAFFDHVRLLGRADHEFRAPVLTFDAPIPLVDYGKRAVMRGIEHLGKHASVIRVALHPADVHGARPLDHILRRIRRLKRTRQLISYDQLLARLGDEQGEATHG